MGVSKKYVAKVSPCSGGADGFYATLYEESGGRVFSYVMRSGACETRRCALSELECIVTNSINEQLSAIGQAFEAEEEGK